MSRSISPVVALSLLVACSSEGGGTMNELGTVFASDSASGGGAADPVRPGATEGVGNTGNTPGSLGGAGNTGNWGGAGNTGNVGNTGGTGNTGNEAGAGNQGNTGNEGGSGDVGNDGGARNNGGAGNAGGTDNAGGTGNEPPINDGDGVEIDGTCHPICTPAATDPENDGWGWENEETCVRSDHSLFESGAPCFPEEGPASGGEGGTGNEGNVGGEGNTGNEAGSGGDGAGGQGNAACSSGGTVSGFYVEDGKLFDNHCNEFLMRGVNYPTAWFGDNGQQRFGDIGSVDANAVRVVLATGGQWNRIDGNGVSNIISWARANSLVAVLEVHDSTGWGESAGAVHPDDAVDYWLSSDIRSAIDGQEAYVIINIANEPFGNTMSDQWASFHQGAVQELRAAGLSHTLMVDAPNWGQDWQNTMRDGNGANQIFEADPDRNVVFSVHMYDVYGTDQVVRDYMTRFLEKGLPLVVGEFAADHGPGNEVAEGPIMDYAEQFGVGYLGWSWSGNSSDLASLDITSNFNVGSLTTWGDRLINGANGIRATAQPCSCFQ